MPAIMVILNIVFITGVVVGIVGLCAWGIVTDRPFATRVTNWGVAHSRRGRVNPRAPREAYPGHGHSPREAYPGHGHSPREAYPGHGHSLGAGA